MSKETVRGTFKRFFDVSAWLGTSEIKRNTNSLKGLMRYLFVVQKPERKETFSEAVERYALDAKALKERQQQFFLTAMIYLGCCLGVFFYAIYLYIKAHYQAMAIAIAFSFMLFSLFFREHFWYTQIKHKRLGFTFCEWCSSLFKIH